MISFLLVLFVDMAEEIRTKSSLASSLLVSRNMFKKTGTAPLWMIVLLLPS